MDELTHVVNEISARDDFYGIFAGQILIAHNNEQYVLATAGLFVLIEQSVKHGADMTNGTFHEASTKLFKANKVTKNEHDAIEELRCLRNLMFHKNMHAGAIISDGLVHKLDENETYGEFVNSHLLAFLQIIKKLLS